MPLRVSAYYALHYGKEYLPYSLRCIYDHVDKIFLVYSERPTRGEESRIPNPDSFEDLKEAVGTVPDPKSKVEWHCGDWWGHEGKHRQFGTELCFLRGKADICIQFDHDEVFHGDYLEEAIALVSAGDARIYRINFIHLWRSFGWACTDEMMPVRLQKNHGNGEAYLRLGKPIYHLGYAQRPELVRYKMPIHGHRAEFRHPPEIWFREKFMAWMPGGPVSDVHPVCMDIWHPKQFEKWELPELMREHPYWDKEIIE